MTKIYIETDRQTVIYIETDRQTDRQKKTEIYTETDKQQRQSQGKQRMVDEEIAIRFISWLDR